MFDHFWYQLVQVALKTGFKTIGVSSAKEVFCLFVCMLAGYAKTAGPVFTEFDGEVAHGPWKNPLVLMVIWITLRSLGI